MNDCVFYDMGTLFRKEGKDYVSWGIVEKDKDSGRIQFYILSSKLPGFYELGTDDVRKIHDFAKEAGSYKETDAAIGVRQIYLGETNVNPIRKYL